MPFSSKEASLSEALNCIYSDLLMLKDGDTNWAFDPHSISATISMVERTAEILHLGLEDVRE